MASSSPGTCRPPTPTGPARHRWCLLTPEPRRRCASTPGRIDQLPDTGTRGHRGVPLLGRQQRQPIGLCGFDVRGVAHLQPVCSDRAAQGSATVTSCTAPPGSLAERPRTRPPSARGSATSSAGRTQPPSAMAAAFSTALRVPANLSGQTTTRTQSSVRRTAPSRSRRSWSRARPVSKQQRPHRRGRSELREVPLDVVAGGQPCEQRIASSPLTSTLAIIGKSRRSSPGRTRRSPRSCRVLVCRTDCGEPDDRDTAVLYCWYRTQGSNCA